MQRGKILFFIAFIGLFILTTYSPYSRSEEFSLKQEELCTTPILELDGTVTSMMAFVVKYYNEVYVYEDSGEPFYIKSPVWNGPYRADGVYNFNIDEVQKRVFFIFSGDRREVCAYSGGEQQDNEPIQEGCTEEPYVLRCEGTYLDETSNKQIQTFICCHNKLDRCGINDGREKAAPIGYPLCVRKTCREIEEEFRNTDEGLKLCAEAGCIPTSKKISSPTSRPSSQNSGGRTGGGGSKEDENNNGPISALVVYPGLGCIGPALLPIRPDGSGEIDALNKCEEQPLCPPDKPIYCEGLNGDQNKQGLDLTRGDTCCKDDEDFMWDNGVCQCRKECEYPFTTKCMKDYILYSVPGHASGATIESKRTGAFTCCDERITKCVANGDEGYNIPTQSIGAPVCKPKPCNELGEEGCKLRNDCEAEYKEESTYLGGGTGVQMPKKTFVRCKAKPADEKVGSELIPERPGGDSSGDIPKKEEVKFDCGNSPECSDNAYKWCCKDTQYPICPGAKKKRNGLLWPASFIKAPNNLDNEYGICPCFENFNYGDGGFRTDNYIRGDPCVKR